MNLDLEIQPKYSDHVVDFSSRGPTLIGDPKPDLMSIGAYSFTPSSVTKTIHRLQTGSIWNVWRNKHVCSNCIWNSCTSNAKS